MKAKEIPSELVVDLSEFDMGDTINISNIDLPEGATPTITGRDFVIANIQAPSGLRSAEDEVEESKEEEEAINKEATFVEVKGFIKNEIACKAEFNLILPEEIKKYNLKG